MSISIVSPTLQLLNTISNIKTQRNTAAAIDQNSAAAKVKELQDVNNQLRETYKRSEELTRMYKDEQDNVTLSNMFLGKDEDYNKTRESVKGNYNRLSYQKEALIRQMKDPKNSPEAKEIYSRYLGGIR